MLAAWRRTALGRAQEPETKGPYDLVVVGRGYSGIGAAISAARMGLLIGEIVDEFADKAKKSPGTYEEFEDAKKEALVRAEPNIELFLNTHAYAATRDGDRITSVTCLDTRTSRELRFTGTFFCDATGHATIGHLAGAETVMEPQGRMGMRKRTSRTCSWPAAASRSRTRP